MLSDTYRNPRWFQSVSSVVARRLRGRRLPANPVTAMDILQDQLRTRLQQPAMTFNTESEAEWEWHRIAEEIRGRILREGPGQFLRWKIVEETMAVSNAWFVVREYLDLRGRPDWIGRWSATLAEDPTGDPIPFALCPSSSGNLVHHAWVAARLLDETGLRLEQLSSITEFGGGYGSFSRLLRRLGFRGLYTIYDLEVMSALQAYYLQSLGFEVAYAAGFEGASTRCVFDRATFNAPLAQTPSLFIALWSLSETSNSTRSVVVDSARAYDYWLIGYQDNFGEVDNRRFVDSWKAGLPNAEWTDQALTHLPGHHLLIGQRSSPRTRVRANQPEPSP